MDYGKPKVEGSIVALCSDEHSTLFPLEGNEKTTLEIGDVVMMKPSHVDPTIAKHPRILCMDGEYIIDEWPIDLRDW